MIVTIAYTGLRWGETIGLEREGAGGRLLMRCRKASPLAGEGDGHDVKADDTVKVPEIGCSDAPPGGYGGRRDEPVVCPDILAGCGEFGPDAGVRTSGEEAEGQRGKRGQDRLDEGLTAGAVL